MQPLPVRPGYRTPHTYFSHTSTAKKLDFAQEQFDHVRELGYRPVAASITGSTLRGHDTFRSDLDGLVLVDQKRWKATVLDNGVVMESIDNFYAKLSTSVPYVEFITSPFMFANPCWTPFLASLRYNPYILQRHAAKFIRHSNDHASMPKDKKYRHSFASWHLITYGSPVLPRRFLYPGEAPLRFWQWHEAAMAGEI